MPISADENSGRLPMYVGLALMLVWGLVVFLSMPSSIGGLQLGAAFLGFGLIAILARKLISRFFAQLYRIAPLIDLWGNETAVRSSLLGGGLGLLAIGCAFLIRGLLV